MIYTTDCGRRILLLIMHNNNNNVLARHMILYYYYAARLQYSIVRLLNGLPPTANGIIVYYILYTVREKIGFFTRRKDPVRACVITKVKTFII